MKVSTAPVPEKTAACQKRLSMMNATIAPSTSPARIAPEPSVLRPS
ncbi:hypothetical protein [Actinoplanes nipponensis]